MKRLKATFFFQATTKRQKLAYYFTRLKISGGMAGQYLEMHKQYLADILPYVPTNKAYNVEEKAAEYCKNLFEASPTENFKGYRLPPGFTAKSAAWQYGNWMPEKGDVLVASYPKTGWFF